MLYLNALYRCDNRLAVFGRFINIFYASMHDFTLYQIVG